MSTFTNQSKNNSVFANQSKNNSSFVNQSKNNSSYTDQVKSGPTIITSFLLLQDGSKILQQDGSGIILNQEIFGLPVFTNFPKTLTPIIYYYFLIDNVFLFLIDSTFTLLLGDITPGMQAVYTNQVKH